MTLRLTCRLRKGQTVKKNVDDDVVTAQSEPQRMVSLVLHLFPPSCCVLRSQHVRRSGGRELPQVSRKSGTRRKGSASRDPRA